MNMNIFFYTILFIMGTVFGSFYTLAIYRIPKKQNITHKHSYCPNCEHKLGFLDMIPVFSYIFLGAKCRYCKQKIRPRYFILELLSGIVFVMLALSIKLDIYQLKMPQIISFVFIILYTVFLFLTAGIDRENRKIERSVTIYGIVISIMYIIYLCIVEQANIYRYVMYMIAYIVILLLDTMTLKKCAKDKYVYGLLSVVIISVIFTGEYVAINSVIFTLLIIFFYLLISKYIAKKNRGNVKEEELYKNLDIAFYLSISNIILYLFVLFSSNYKI